MKTIKQNLTESERKALSNLCKNSFTAQTEPLKSSKFGAKLLGFTWDEYKAVTCSRPADVGISTQRKMLHKPKKKKRLRRRNLKNNSTSGNLYRKHFR